MYDTIPASVWRQYGKPRKTCQNGHCSDWDWTPDLSNTKKECPNPLFSRSAGLIIRILRNPEVHYRGHNSPLLIAFLSKKNAVPNIPYRAFKIHFNSILPSTPRSCKWTFSFRFFNPNLEIQKRYERNETLWPTEEKERKLQRKVDNSR